MIWSLESEALCDMLRMTDESPLSWSSNALRHTRFPPESTAFLLHFLFHYTDASVTKLIHSEAIN